MGPNPCLDRLLLLFWVQYIKGWSSFTRFAVGDYLLQITKERMLLITSKNRMFANQGEKWLNWLRFILGRFSSDVRKLL